MDNEFLELELRSIISHRMLGYDCDMSKEDFDGMIEDCAKIINQKFKTMEIRTIRKISTRCGKGSCEFYDKHNNDSKCSKYPDRRLCSISNKQRRKSANTSKRRGDAIGW